MLIFALIVAALFLAGIIRLTLNYWDLHETAGPDFSRRNYRVWILKGMAFPALACVLVNSGLNSHFPPLLPYIAAMRKPGASAVVPWLRLVLPATFVIASYWAAATFLLLLASHAFVLHSSRRDILSALLVWLIILSPITGLLLYIFGLPGIGCALVLLLIPVIRDQLALGNPRAKSFSPVYSHALEKIKAGKYRAAEKEVLRQLEKCESDFAGWMLLAELYATQFNSVADAEEVVHQVCRAPETTREQMSDALHRLADWHLKFGRSTVDARRVLQLICDAFPATHYGDVAEQRIRRLCPVPA